VGWQVAARSNGKIPGRKWWVVTLSSPPATASSVPSGPNLKEAEAMSAIPRFSADSIREHTRTPVVVFCNAWFISTPNPHLTHTVALCNSQCIP
jgi:hypothetical protein